MKTDGLEKSESPKTRVEHCREVRRRDKGGGRAEGGCKKGEKKTGAKQLDQGVKAEGYEQRHGRWLEEPLL